MIKKLLAKSKLICKVYKKYKERNNFKTNYKFIDRRTGKKSLCYPSVAKFMWGENGYLPSIDNMNKTLNNDEFSYTVCPIRFSIGAIMFTSDTIKKIGGFTASKIGNDLGIDEVQILSLAYNYSLATIVSKNTLVGHLSFGKQNAIMKEYYENNKDLMFKS